MHSLTMSFFLLRQRKSGLTWVIYLQMRVAQSCNAIMNNHFVFYCWQGSSSPTILPNFCPVSIFAFKYVKYRSIKLSAAKNAIVEYDQGILSTAAVAAMPYFNHTVLFIGTRQGQLLKVHVYFFSLLIISPSPSSKFPLCLATTLFAQIKYVALYICFDQIQFLFTWTCTWGSVLWSILICIWIFFFLQNTRMQDTPFYPITEKLWW